MTCYQSMLDVTQCLRHNFLRRIRISQWLFANLRNIYFSNKVQKFDKHQLVRSQLVRSQLVRSQLVRSQLVRNSSAATRPQPTRPQPTRPQPARPQPARPQLVRSNSSAANSSENEISRKRTSQHAADVLSVGMFAHQKVVNPQSWCIC